jgi:hypothetical protein
MCVRCVSADIDPEALDVYEGLMRTRFNTDMQEPFSGFGGSGARTVKQLHFPKPIRVVEQVVEEEEEVEEEEVEEEEVEEEEVEEEEVEEADHVGTKKRKSRPDVSNFFDIT